jgi:adenine-specific DNA-methyltransferase
MPKKLKSKPANKTQQTAPYKHPEAQSLMRPEVGTQAQFKKKKPPKTYRYDSSLSPALDWDTKNPAREQGEALIKQVLDAKNLEEAKAAASKLKTISKPFLNWAGKAERLSFDVPTLPLFIHERLSTKAIIETLAGHKTDQQQSMFELFGDPQRSITDQVLKAYEYQDNWTNRMVLGDSLVVMNSLLHYEGLGGQVQMIYMDPPYGVKFGSNFQPFVRKRDVSHNDDEDMTREPEMVQAYRDTWEMGLHSYLTYLRDRLLLARDLLTPSGSIFVQISDENLHHVREVMDEVFGAENFCSVIPFRTAISQPSDIGTPVCDYVVWYGRDKERTKSRKLHKQKTPGDEGASVYTFLELSDGSRRRMTDEEIINPALIPMGARIFSTGGLDNNGVTPTGSYPFPFCEKEYRPGPGKHWQTTLEGMKRLQAQNRLIVSGSTLRYVRYIDDYPVTPIPDLWYDTITGSFTDAKYMLSRLIRRLSNVAFS